MGMLLLLAGAVVSALCGSSHAVCSPCPFQWVRNQNNCYRYFPEDLSYEEAVMFCESDSIAGRVAELATVTSLEELTFIMEYIDRIFVNASSTEVPETIWLRNNTETSPGKLVICWFYARPTSVCNWSLAHDVYPLYILLFGENNISCQWLSSINSVLFLLLLFCGVSHHRDQSKKLILFRVRISISNDIKPCNEYFTTKQFTEFCGKKNNR